MFSLENDKEEKWADLSKIEDWEKADRKELLDLIREKGIVGIGGATFPTHVKLNPPANTKIDTLLLNGAECEPYLNSDNRLMLENPKSIVEGIKIIKKILDVKDVYVGIEDNKIVKVHLLGSCLNCSVNQMTLRSGVEMMIKKYAPEIEKVVNVN